MKIDTMQVTTQASITNLEKTVGQILCALNRIEAKGNDEFPSQSLPPPNVSAITLRSGRKVDGIEKEIKLKAQSAPDGDVEKKNNSKQVDELPWNTEHLGEILLKDTTSYQEKAPFTFALQKKVKHEPHDDFLGALQRCEVKIPLKDLLKNIPKCPKLVKDLCN